MGKSGHIAILWRPCGPPAPQRCISTGEASHGDLGIITESDVVLALTWSGETVELSNIFHYCNRYGVTLIVATAQPTARPRARRHLPEFA